MSYHISTARYEKMQENGEIKRVNEKFLTDSLTVTEAEAMVVENLSRYVSGDIEVTKVEKSAISEVFAGDSPDKFFLAKLALIIPDENTGKDRKTKVQWLVGANDYDEAKDTLQQEINKFTTDIEILGLTESPIVEYFKPKLS